MNTSQSDRPTVLFFDIDGTLIDSGGAGTSALLLALQREFDVTRFESVDIHGRTDLGIFVELLERHAVEPTAENIRRFSARYFTLLPETLREKSGRVLPGVRELLNRLSRRSDVRLGLLTGNMQRSARMKLQHYGLDPYFSFGIFGDHAMDRQDLAKPTLELIRQTWNSPTNLQRIVVVGDTPKDIELAQAIGALSLGVCTGQYGPDALRKATWILPDLASIPTIESLLLPETVRSKN